MMRNATLNLGSSHQHYYFQAKVRVSILDLFLKNPKNILNILVNIVMSIKNYKYEEHTDHNGEIVKRGEF